MFEYKYYIKRERYNYIFERLKQKTTTHKTRYKFDLYLIDDNYFYGLEINMFDDKIVQHKMLIDLECDEDGIYVVSVKSANSKIKRRLIIIK